MRFRLENVLLLVGAVFAALSLEPCIAQETYTFERLWPALPQPWYFSDPEAIDMDSHGNVYVADENNQRIVKLTSEGQFLLEWGGRGRDPGLFTFPGGIALGPDDSVYVLDTFAERVQKFTSEGTFLLTWGSEGSEPGQFGLPRAIHVDDAGNVYVLDSEGFFNASPDNNRVQKFTDTGKFLLQWGTKGSAPGEFNDATDVTTDRDGNVYVADSRNNRIQVFTASGDFLRQWDTFNTDGIDIHYDSAGSGALFTVGSNDLSSFTLDGRLLNEIRVSSSSNDGFFFPSGLAIDHRNHVYIVDRARDTIQKYNISGAFISRWAASGWDPGEFVDTCGIAVDPAGTVYVASGQKDSIQAFDFEGRFLREWSAPDSFGLSFFDDVVLGANGDVYGLSGFRDRVFRFTPMGDFISSWGGQGTEPGLMDNPMGMAVDSVGNIYVSEWGNGRVQVFTADGAFLRIVGEPGEGPGQFDFPTGITLDENDNLYVFDLEFRIQKFDPDGNILFQFGELLFRSPLSPLGNVQFVRDMASDGNGHIYVVDGGLHHIQKFTTAGEAVSIFSQFGHNPGSVNDPRGIALGPDGRIFIADSQNHRVQVFRPAQDLPTNKAIVVVGSAGVTVSQRAAAQMAGNVAYQALLHQGYTKDTTFYLAANASQDLDGNGLFDDIDGGATSQEILSAVTDWAADADNVVLFILGSGSVNGVTVAKGDTLTPAALDNALDALQSRVGGAVAVIIDAGFSGVFIPALTPPVQGSRIVMTSTNDAEPAVFLSSGTVSFSNYFWVQVFNGLDPFTAFSSAASAMSGDVNYQNPQIDDNGNGVANEPADGIVAAAADLFNETAIEEQAPVLSAVSPPQFLNADETLASFFAEGIAEGLTDVARVWGLVTPPAIDNSKQGSTLLGLAEFDLEAVSESRFEGSFDGFVSTGVYTVDFFALDSKLNLSQGKRTTIEKAIIPNTLIVSVFVAETNEPIEGARVTLSPFSGASLFTKESGLAVFSNLPADTYTIDVSAGGFLSSTNTVIMTAGAFKSIGFGLQIDTSPPPPPNPFSCAANTGAPQPPTADLILVAGLAILLSAKQRLRQKMAQHRS